MRDELGRYGNGIAYYKREKYVLIAIFFNIAVILHAVVNILFLFDTYCRIYKLSSDNYPSKTQETSASAPSM